MIFILYRAAVKQKFPNWIQKSLSVGQGNLKDLPEQIINFTHIKYISIQFKRRVLLTMGEKNKIAF